MDKELMLQPISGQLKLVAPEDWVQMTAIGWVKIGVIYHPHTDLVKDKIALLNTLQALSDSEKVETTQTNEKI